MKSSENSSHFEFHLNRTWENSKCSGKFKIHWEICFQENKKDIIKSLNKIWLVIEATRSQSHFHSFLDGFEVLEKNWER